MSAPKSNRAEALARRTALARNTESELLAGMKATPVERSYTWLLVTLLVMLIAGGLTGASRLAAVTAWGATHPPPVIQPLGEARWGQDYRQYPATDWALLDSRHVVVATDGGGVHHGRLDSSPEGFWRTYTPKNTGGLLPEASIRKVHFDGKRIWFVGKGASLSSCNRNFEDWQLLYGGGHFVPGLNLKEDLTCLAVSQDQQLFAIGTPNNGIGLYDSVSRQWHRFDEDRTDAKISATQVLFRKPASYDAGKEDLLWLATNQGLTVYRLKRKGTVLEKHREHQWNLPGELGQGKPILALYAPDEARAPKGQPAPKDRPLPLICVVGNGACAEMDVNQGKWKVLVDEGDPALASASGVLSPAAVVPTEDGAWFALPGWGAAHYDATRRRLSLRNAGLAGTDEQGCAITTLAAADPDHPGESLWAVRANGDLFRRTGDRWVPAAPHGLVPQELAFAGGRAIVRGADRVVHALGSAPSPPSKGDPFFQPAPSGLEFGPAEILPRGRQLFLGELGPASQNRLIRYDGGKRSWSAIPCPTRSPLRSLRAHGDRLWAVSENGEAGSFGPIGTDASPAYTAELGKSEMAGRSGRVVTAETSDQGLWLIREEGRGVYGTYVDRRGGRRIERVGELPFAAVPLALRGTGREPFLHVRMKGRGTLLHGLAGKGWREVGDAPHDVVQIAAPSDGVAALGLDGTVTLHHDTAVTERWFTGQGTALWRRLSADAFGRLWGVTPDERMLLYTSATATWVTVLNQGAVDLVVRPPVNGSQEIDVATRSGLKVCYATAQPFEPGAPQLKAVTSLSRADIRQIQGHGTAATVLASDEGRLAVWTQTQPGQRWVRRLAPGGESPSSAAWAAARWAQLAGGELWLASDGGAVWRYELGRGEWTQQRLKGSAPVEFQRGRSGELWWLDADGTIHQARPAKGEQSSFKGRPEYVSPAWQWSSVSGGLGGLLAPGAGILLLGLLTYWGVLRHLELTEEDCLAHGRLANTHVSPVDWGRTLGTGMAAVLLTGGSGLVLLQLDRSRFQPSIRATAPFTNQEFEGVVKRFTVADQQLRVQTEEGTWIFQRTGETFTPQEFLPGRSLPSSPAAPRTQTEGPWRLTHDSDGYRLQLAAADGSLHPFTLGPGGFAEDHLQGLACEGERLLALTPAGLAEFEPNQGSFRRKISPLPHGVSGRLFAHNSAVYFRDKNQRWARHDPARGGWEAVTSVRPLQVARHGLRWQETPEQAELPVEDFDAVARQFRADKCVGLTVDRERQLWFDTEAGWRRRGAPTLERPVNNAPQAATQTAELPATPTWTCLRTETPGNPDVVAFRMTAVPDSKPTGDPFGVRGRWPDEDARVVQPDEDGVWLGTAGGVRYRGRDGSERLDLPGVPVSRLAVHGGVLYCRGGAAAYRRTGTGWVASSAPETAFGPARDLVLPLGAAVDVRLQEVTAREGVTTRVEGFDPHNGRLEQDTVLELASERDGFWVRTPVNVQRLRLEGARLREPAGYLSGQKLLGLRRCAQRHLHAGTEAGDAWRFEESRGRWQPCDVKDNPFRTAVRHEVSPILWSLREFNENGDRFSLLSDAGRATLTHGKITSDFIEGVAAAGGQRWQATPAGVVTNVAAPVPWRPGVISWPAAAPDSFQVAYIPASGGLFCRRGLDVYALTSDAKGWREANRDAFKVLRVSFEGKKWVIASEAGFRPSMQFRLRYEKAGGTTTPAEEWESSLNARGQFSFDSIQSVTTRQRKGAGELWLTHGTGVAVYTPGAKNLTASMAASVRYLAPSTVTRWGKGEWITELTTDASGRTWLGFRDYTEELHPPRPTDWHLFRICNRDAAPDPKQKPGDRPTTGEIFHRMRPEEEGLPNPILRLPSCSLSYQDVRTVARLAQNRTRVDLETKGRVRHVELPGPALHVTSAGDQVWLLSRGGVSRLALERVPPVATGR